MTATEKRPSNSKTARQLFFKRWLKNPRTLGAVLPSSRLLAQMIAQEVFVKNKEALAAGKYVLELGAGTGVFTQALLKAGVPKSQLVCVELDPSLFAYLKERFSELTLLRGDAGNLSSFLPKVVQENLAAVVSGIPMTNLSRNKQMQIVTSIFNFLPNEGKFYQFTYLPFSSIPAQAFRLKKRRIGFILRNFPPATVWSYERATHATCT